MTPTPAPICPKCGYDQSGAIATWETQCPVRGTCPECGLAFAWADVFDPSRVHLHWYVEHATNRREMISRSPSTCGMLLIPNRFWKRVTVTTPIYVARLWSYVGAMALICYLLTTLARLGAIVYNRMHWNHLYSTFHEQNPESGFQAQLYVADTSTLEYWLRTIGSAFTTPFVQYDSATQMASLILGMVLLWALIIAAVPITRRIAQIRLAHVHRAAAWSCFAVVYMYAIVSLSESLASGFNSAGLALSPNWPGAFNVQQLRFNQAYAYSNYFITAIFIAMIIWIQWFWITAVVKGWRIRSILLPILGFIASVLGGFTVFMYILVY